MTRRTLILLVLLTAGCGSPSPGEQPSESTSTSTVPIETASTTSTTTDPGPVEIPGRALIWDPGTYTTDSFLVPMSFEVAASGWRSLGVEAEWFEVKFVEAGTDTIAAALVIVAYRPGDSVDELVAAITSIEGVSTLSEAMPDVVGGFDAIVVDVEGTPDPTFRAGGATRECSEPGGSGRFFIDGAGYQFFTKGLSAFGIPACHQSRVWVVDVDGASITMIGTVEKTEDFARLMPEVEHLLDGLQFEQSH